MSDKKNVVFMLNIKMNNSELDGDRWRGSRSDPYIYSVNSWQNGVTRIMLNYLS